MGARFFSETLDYFQQTTQRYFPEDKLSWKQTRNENFVSCETVLTSTGFSGFIHRPIFWKLEHTMFRKLDLFPSSGEEGDTYSDHQPPVERNNDLAILDRHCLSIK
jgi:hypothetical protein